MNLPADPFDSMNTVQQRHLDEVKKQLLTKYMRSPKGRQRLLQSMVTPAETWAAGLQAKTLPLAQRRVIERHAWKLLKTAESLLGRMVLLQEVRRSTVYDLAIVHLQDLRREYFASRKIR
jgi:hypothetical protein